MSIYGQLTRLTDWINVIFLLFRSILLIPCFIHGSLESYWLCFPKEYHSLIPKALHIFHLVWRIVADSPSMVSRPNVKHYFRNTFWFSFISNSKPSLFRSSLHRIYFVRKVSFSASHVPSFVADFIFSKALGFGHLRLLQAPSPFGCFFLAKMKIYWPVSFQWRSLFTIWNARNDCIEYPSIEIPLPDKLLAGREIQ